MGYAKNISLRWSYPKEMNSAWESDDSYGRGIYQITRDFGGNKSLLYIGLVKSEGRDFYLRLDEHWEWMEQTRGKVYIRFGKIKPKQGFTITEDIIETIEGAIIYEHQPKWNSSKRSSYTIYHDMTITNTGYRGFVNEIVDTRNHYTNE